MEDNLKDKTVKGVAWNSVDRIANYGISFLVSIVLARLLTPEDYGLIGLINIFIVIFNTILDGGLSTALIRKITVNDTEYNTVFYANLVLSILLTVSLYLGARWISTFFERPELIPLLRAMSFILIINALSIVHLSILTRKINFKDQTKISVIAHVGSGIIGIALAFCGFGVWALVFQQLTSRLFSTVLYWFYAKWSPKMVFSWRSFKELFDFGWKLLVARVLNSVWGQIYNGIIGKFYSPSTLGLYTRALQFGHLFSNGISDVVLKVSLPAMSSIQNDNERLVAATRRMVRTTMFVSFILMIGMAAAAKSLIYVLIGEKWLPCVPMLQILCLNLVMNPVAFINENLLTVKGRSDKLLVLQLIKIAIAVIPMLLGIFVGVYWMLGVSALTSWLGVFIITYYTKKYYGYSAFDQLRDILPSFGFSLLMAIPIYLISLLPITDYLLLPIEIIVGGLMVVILGNLMKIEEYKYIKNIVIGFMNNRKNKL